MIREELTNAFRLTQHRMSSLRKKNKFQRQMTTKTDRSNFSNNAVTDYLNLEQSNQKWPNEKPEIDANPFVQLLEQFLNESPKITKQGLRSIQLSRETPDISENEIESDRRILPPKGKWELFT